MHIKQGDIYWVKSRSEYPHPYVVVAADDSDKVIVYAMTSNLKKVNMPGNVLLDEGEANLMRQSVVEVSKSATVEKAQLGDHIGTLSAQRIQQILAGIKFVQNSFLDR